MTTPNDGDAKRPEHNPFSRLVRGTANPLSAVLAETRLLLLDAESLTPDAVASLRAIEAAALKMRVVLGVFGEAVSQTGPRCGNAGHAAKACVTPLPWAEVLDP